MKGRDCAIGVLREEIDFRPKTGTDRVAGLLRTIGVLKRRLHAPARKVGLRVGQMYPILNRRG